MADQDLRTVVRDAATAARKRWLDPDDPCGTSMIRDLNERDFIADAVAVATVKHLLRQAQFRFGAYSVTTDELNTILAQFVSEGGVSSEPDAAGLYHDRITPASRRLLKATPLKEGGVPVPSEPTKYSACRVCGRGARTLGQHIAIATYGVHTNARGETMTPNHGTAYCDHCKDETLVVQPAPLPVAPPAPSESK